MFSRTDFTPVFSPARLFPLCGATLPHPQVSTEMHESPKSAAVSRRVRASSVPPRATSVPPSTRTPQGYHAHAQRIKVLALPRPRPMVVPRATRPASVVYLPHAPPSYYYDALDLSPASVYYVYAPAADPARFSDNQYNYYYHPSSSPANHNKPSSSTKPVVLQQGAVHSERADRARSVALEQPAPPRSARGASMPPGTFYHRSKVPPLSLPPAPLPTSGMRATRHQPASYNAAMLRARARSLDRGGTLGAGSPTAAAPIPTQQLWAHRPVTLRKDASLASRARTDPRNPYSAGLRRVASEPRLLERGEGSQHTYYYPALPASHKILYRVPGAGEKALSRHVYSHRGRFGPDSKPPRPSLAGFPQVYVPWNGPGPSNRSKVIELSLFLTALYRWSLQNSCLLLMQAVQFSLKLHSVLYITQLALILSVMTSNLCISSPLDSRENLNCPQSKFTTVCAKWQVMI